MSIRIGNRRTSKASDADRFQKAASEIIERHVALSHLRGKTFVKFDTLSGCVFVLSMQTTNYILNPIELVEPLEMQEQLPLSTLINATFTPN